MRRILTGLLAAVLAVGFLAAGPAEAKVYKMKPEERTAALKEKKARKARKKAGKASAEAPGGWVEVKPGAKPERKARKSAQVDEAAKAGARKGKKAKKSAEAEVKPAKKASKATVAAGDKKLGKNSRKKAAAKGDRLVSKSYAGEAKVRGTSTEVRRSGPAAGPAAGDDLSAYSVNRPGQEKSAAPAVAPEVRHEVQPGPADTAKPLGTESKGGEGRF
ncbi:MAG: hypothetical protein KKA55_12860 [Proteobacteria bacterium]|nr:hypothetical protein [Pseudomonadota bacterium]MBU1596409.1 hypothetical protein [Pseudomonadota bacterium]